MSSCVEHEHEHDHRGSKRGGEEDGLPDDAPSGDDDEPNQQPPNPLSSASYPRQRPACRPCQKSKVYCSRNTPCSSCRRKGIDCVAPQQLPQPQEHHQSPHAANQQHASSSSAASSQGPACLPCRKVKVYCDRSAPSCSRCRRKAIECTPQLRGRGRPPGIRSNPQSSGYKHGGSRGSDPPSPTSSSSSCGGPPSPGCCSGHMGGHHAPVPNWGGPMEHWHGPQGLPPSDGLPHMPPPKRQQPYLSMPPPLSIDAPPYGSYPPPACTQPCCVPPSSLRGYPLPGVEGPSALRGYPNAAPAVGEGGGKTTAPWAVLAAAGSERWWQQRHQPGRDAEEYPDEDRGEAAGDGPRGLRGPGGKPGVSPPRESSLSSPSCLTELGTECSLLLALRTGYHPAPLPQQERQEGKDGWEGKDGDRVGKNKGPETLAVENVEVDVSSKSLSKDNVAMSVAERKVIYEI